MEAILPTLEARGVSLERLVQGLPVDLDHLRDPTRRIDWDVNVELVERATALLGPEGLEDMGMRSHGTGPWHLIRLLGVFVSDSRFLYRVACRWVGPSFFTNVTSRYTELPDGRVRIEMEIPESYRGCPQIFQACLSSFRTMPRVLGREDAEVEGEISPHRATFTIRPPRRASPVSWLRRLVRLPSAARAAFEAFAEQQEQLNRALEGVRQAHAELRTHVEQVSTIDRLGDALVRQLGSEQLPDRILDLLTQRFGWKGASLWMTAPEDESVIFFGRSGSAEGDACVTYPLVLGDCSLGRLEVWNADAGQSGAERALLEKLLPWVAMTVRNARSAATLGSGVGTGLRWASKSGRDLFVILDGNGQILYAGPRTDELLGYEQDDLMRMDLTELIHPDDWPRLSRDFAALAQHSSSAIYSRARVQQRDGSFRRMEGVAIKVLSEAGADVFLISCGDVAARPASH